MTEPTVDTERTPSDAAPVAFEHHLVSQVSDIAGIAPGIDATHEAGLELRARSQWSYARSRFLRHRLAMTGLVVLLLVFAAGAFANYVAPYSPTALDLEHVYQSPTTVGHHFFGTDEIGRDYLSRNIYGIRTSEEVGVFVAFLSTIIGIVIGAVAGYFGGWIDNILMRITDLVLTLPALAILLTASALWGQGSQWRVSFILAGFFWTGLARIVRGVFLSLREKEYVEAAHALGASNKRIIFKHLIPNALGSLIVWATLGAATAIILEASLTFLGFGVNDPNSTSLGRLVSDGVQAASTRPWLFYFPGIALLILVLAINLIGDGIRDAFDPSNRRVRA
jgi:ABC-type dipeptide/oligopeptide/nickel transport system permease subunit